MWNTLYLPPAPSLLCNYDTQKAAIIKIQMVFFAPIGLKIGQMELQFDQKTLKN